jgi:hypothetical protein
MTATQIRRQAKRRIDALSPARLQVADDFLAYLQEREGNEATEELLAIPGFLKTLRRVERSMAAGKVTPVENLRRKY